MFHLLPTNVQWRKWSLPSKLTCIGFYLAILSILLTVGFYIWPMFSGNSVVQSAQTATTHGNNSPGVNQSGTVTGSGTLNQAGRDLNIDNRVFVFTNGNSKMSVDLDELERRYPLSYILFRPDGSKTKVLQKYTKPACKVEMDWDAIKVRQVSPDKLEVSVPTTVIHMPDGHSAKLNGSFTQNLPIENKANHPEILNAIVDGSGASAAVVFEVMDNHYLRPVWILGIRPTTKKEIGF